MRPGEAAGLIFLVVLAVGAILLGVIVFFILESIVQAVTSLVELYMTVIQ